MGAGILLLSEYGYILPSKLSYTQSPKAGTHLTTEGKSAAAGG